MHDAELAALLAGAVVRQQQDDGVVEDAEALEILEEPADLGVGVLEEGGERLLEPGRQAPLVLRQRVPRLDAGVAGGEPGVGGQEAHLDLPGEPPLAGDVPSLVEPAPPLVEVVGGGLVGGVHGAEGEIGEERAVRPDRDRVVDEPDGVVDQVLAQVVALLRGRRGLHVVVVVHQVRGELVGLPFEEPVEAVEAALQRPLVEGPGGRCVLHGREVPLAHGERGVALVTQHLGHGGGVVGDLPAHVGVAAVEVGDGAHAHGVVVAARQQRGAGGRAQRRDVEVGVADAVGRQGVDVGCGELGAVAAEVGEPGVVEQDDDHVRGIGARVRRDGPPGLRLRLGPGDHAVEGLELLHGDVLGSWGSAAVRGAAPGIFCQPV